jgi:hypothetical protein
VSYDHIVRTEPCSDYEATKKEPITLEYSRTGELRDGDIYEVKEVE